MKSFAYDMFIITKILIVFKKKLIILIFALLSYNISQNHVTETYVLYQLLQAMDRAHRLGQRKVVNVHRLIMRGTLEEKVMSLQRFKMSVANAVINADNASLKTMNTDQLLDLFTSAESRKKVKSKLWLFVPTILFCPDSYFFMGSC